MAALTSPSSHAALAGGETTGDEEAIGIRVLERLGEAPQQLVVEILPRSPLHDGALEGGLPLVVLQMLALAGIQTSVLVANPKVDLVLRPSGSSGRARTFLPRRPASGRALRDR
jgi:hypothetical protein